jgi:Ion channel
MTFHRPMSAGHIGNHYFLREPPSVRNAAGVIVTATAAVVIGAGILISLLDGEEYPNVWIGMWYALQTVTTVGYGDVTPTELGGRLVGVLLMLSESDQRGARQRGGQRPPGHRQALRRARA